jgi:uncharacterized protein
VPPSRPSRFADELIATIELGLAGSAVPAVKALHQPPAFTRGRKDGEFCALELADGSIGLTYALLDGTAAALRGTGPAGRLEGEAAIGLARRFRSADPGVKALGLAAINALSQHLFRRAGYLPAAALDSIGMLDPQAGDRIGMVGWFPPLTQRIVASGASLVVVELDPSLAGEKDGFVVTLDRRVLAGCDKVLATTTLMLNDTLEAVLGACVSVQRLVLVGPGGGCVPDPLFARGVSALGGTAVVDRDRFVAALTRGDPWGAFARKYCIEARDYPGLATLVGGAA